MESIIHLFIYSLVHDLTCIIVRLLSVNQKHWWLPLQNQNSTIHS